MSTESIGELEHLILLAILNHPHGASALQIRATLRERGGRTVIRGALYRSLDRLGEKGLLEWTVEKPSEERGGHTRRLYTVSAGGLAVLRERRSALERLWAGAVAPLGMS